jgi:hypothetical protein
MANSEIEKLKSHLKMGARGNKYKIKIAAPQGANDDDQINTLCKGASIPAKSIGQIEVFTQGRKIVVAGDATYESSWTLTFWNTEDHDLRSKFIDWLKFIDNFDEHKRDATDMNSYMSSSAQVEQLSTVDNSVKATYEFKNLWPVNISEIELADDQQDTIEEFSVEFAYSHYIKL